MGERTILGTALVAGLLSAGCITSSKPTAEISPGIFEGQKPRTPAQFEALRALGVRTILSVEALPWDIGPERRHARRYGLRYRDVAMLASPFPPREKAVKKALLILHDPTLRPIYVHCMLGEDRTAFLIGLYRIYFQDWPPQAAWEEMLRSGFHVRFTLRGYVCYFWHHTRKPEWAKGPQLPVEPKPP